MMILDWMKCQDLGELWGEPLGEGELCGDPLGELWGELCGDCPGVLADTFGEDDVLGDDGGLVMFTLLQPKKMAAESRIQHDKLRIFFKFVTSVFCQFVQMPDQYAWQAIVGF